ncbi:MAG: hypothetical protein QM766_11355 [Burkholderiaceae bacterium]
MSERLRTIAWLLVLVAGIGATVVQWEDPDAHDAPDAHGIGETGSAGAAGPRAGAHGHAHDDTHRPARLFAWDLPDVAALTIGDDERSRRFVADDRGWREVDAAGATITDTRGSGAFDAAAYLSLFSQARADRVLARAMPSAPGPDDAGHAGAGLAADPYGLTSPALRIEVVERDGRPLAQVTVGARTPDGYGRYARLASRDAVLIVPEYQFRPAMDALRVGDGR